MWPTIYKLGEPHRHNLDPKRLFVSLLRTQCHIIVKAEELAAVKNIVNFDGTFGISQHSNQICKACWWQACFQARRIVHRSQYHSHCSKSVQACHSGLLPDRHVQPATPTPLRLNGLHYSFNCPMFNAGSLLPWLQRWTVWQSKKCQNWLLKFET